jgi:predicted DsbA family dithiol-disulfide isomerase
MHDKLFANQKGLKGDVYREYAEQLGLDLERFDADFASDDLERMIREDELLAAKFGANGTPAFFINGRFLNGAQPIDYFKSVVDEELADAKKLVDSGTPRAEVFAAIMADAKTEVEK